MPTVIIVGGGITGLTLAYRLQQAAPHTSVTLLEKDARPGGKIRTEEREGFRVEWGPNGFLDGKTTTVTLCRDIGLGDRLLAASTASAKNRYLLLRGRLLRLPDSFASFLGSPVLSWRGKLALLSERYRRPRQGSEDESIDAFARRRAGAEVAEVLADAFVTGIHAGDPTLLSVRAAFPRLVEMEEKYGSVRKGFAALSQQRRAEAKARGDDNPRPGTMWSFPEGLQALVDSLSAHLSAPPITGIAVRRIEKRDGPRSHWRVHGEGHDSWDADAVILACPATEQAMLMADLDAELSSQIGGIAYNRVAVIALGYRESDLAAPLDGFGFLVPQREKRDILGVQWCSSIFPGQRAPVGTVLLRAICGGWNRAEMVDWDDDRLLSAVRAELRTAQGISAAPIFHRIIPWERAIPQYHVGHLARVAAIEERAKRYPGLFLAGNAYRGVALNDCTERSEVLAREVTAYLAHQTSTHVQREYSPEN
jgi:protoporphyrinogen/coproporphyrinogen III oxidase